MKICYEILYLKIHITLGLLFPNHVLISNKLYEVKLISKI